MKDLRITTTAGTEAVLGEAAIEGFGSGLGGEMLRPGDEGYEETRKVWNRSRSRRKWTVPDLPTEIVASPSTGPVGGTKVLER